MRIAAMGIDSDDGRIVRHQILALESLHEPLLNLMLVRSPIAHALTDLLEGRGSNRIHGIPRSKVRLDLLVRKRGLEQSHQIPGADNVFPQASDQLQRAAIDKRNGEHEVIRRILHGDVAMR